MKLSEAYTKAIQYGRLPQSEVEKWTSSANDYNTENKTNINLADGSHPDNFFADALQEAEDPRHHILRKDLELRSNTKSFFTNLYDTVAEHLGVPHTTTEVVSPLAEDVNVKKLSNYENLDKHVYRVEWRTRGKDTENWRNNYSPVFTGIFTPEEFENLKSEFKQS